MSFQSIVPQMPGVGGLAGGCSLRCYYVEGGLISAQSEWWNNAKGLSRGIKPIDEDDISQLENEGYQDTHIMRDEPKTLEQN